MKIIVGNWKMNGNRELADRLVGVSKSSKNTVVICPPFTLLSHIKGVTLGAQDCSAEKNGPYTGDISAVMLKEAGCEWVIIGHSERRQYHNESDKHILRKAEATLEAGLKVIYCIGETIEERNAGKADQIVKSQLSFLSALQNLNHENLVLAYEPVWAIGTGLTPSVEEIAAMHQYIEQQYQGVKVLYGGSVKSNNIKEILAISGISGVLVGGASIDPDSWKKIVQS